MSTAKVRRMRSATHVHTCARLWISGALARRIGLLGPCIRVILWASLASRPTPMQTLTRPSYESLAPHFHQWQKIGDMIDQCIDLMLNLRQSGHPGGSRSKVPLIVASTLGAGMRWDVRRPELAFGDRAVLVAGHCNPLIYAMLA